MKIIHDILGIVMELLNIAISRAEALSRLIGGCNSEQYTDIAGEMYDIYKSLKYLYYETE